MGRSLSQLPISQSIRDPMLWCPHTSQSHDAVPLSAGCFGGTPALRAQESQQYTVTTSPFLCFVKSTIFPSVCNLTRQSSGRRAGAADFCVGRQKHVALHRRPASADFVLEQPGLCVGLLYSAAGFAGLPLVGLAIIAQACRRRSYASQRQHGAAIRRLCFSTSGRSPRNACTF